MGEIRSNQLTGGSIARRLFVQILVLSLLATVVITALQLYFRYGEELRSIEEELQRIEVSRLNSLATHLWLYDEALLRTELEGIMNLPDIIFVEVRGVDGLRIALGAPGPENRIEREYPLVFSHRGQEMELGKLRIHASPDRVRKEFLEDAAALSLGEASKIFVIAFLVFVVFQVTVGRHLRSLGLQARELDLGRPHPPFNLSRPSREGKTADELEYLVSALNELYGSLKRTIKDLHLSNEKLDEEIGERKRAEEELIKAHALLEETQAIGKLGGWEYDIETGRITWTREVYRIYGVDLEYDPSDVDRNISYYAPEDAQVLERAFRKAMELGERYDLECRFIKTNGEPLWVRTNGRPVVVDGKIARVVGIFMDITERKQAEAALRESEERFSVFMENLPAGMFMKDVHGQVVYANRYLRDLFGWTEVLGRFTRELLPPDVAEKMEADDRAVLADGPTTITEWVRDAANRERIFQTSKFPVPREGRPPLLGGIAVDITERKRAEEELRASGAFLDTIIEHSPLSMWVSDETGTMIRMNQACRNLLHVTDEELVGKYNIFEDNVVESRGMMPLVKQVFEQGERVGFTIHYDSSELRSLQLKKARQIVLEVTISPVLDTRGRVVHAIIQHQDMTERMQAEEALRSSLKEKESLLREVHHRVKNNLQIISSLLSLQARQVRNAELYAFLQDTQNRIRSMALLHETLYRSGNLAKVSFPHYVKSVCDHVARSYASEAGNIRLRHDIADVAVDLDHAIPTGLIISELVSNAFKHAFPSRSDGEIVVRLQAADEHTLVLRVTDDGVGLPSGTSPQSTETLGLRLVRNLSRQLDGQMTVTCEQGTVFQIVFPVQSV